MATFPTLPSGAAFTAFPVTAAHEFNAIQAGRDTGKVSARAKWSRPRREWILVGRNLTEGDIHKVMGWIRDDIAGGATAFDFTNLNSSLWDPGKAPTLSQAAGGALGGRTYYVAYTWTDGTNQTNDSTEASYTVGANNYLTVVVPTFPTNATSARLFIGTSTGVLYRSGSVNTSNTTWTEDSASSTVDQDSAAAQKVLYVAATTNFQVGNAVLINSGGAREEVGIIASISAGVSVTLEENLTYTHTAVQADVVATAIGNSGAAAPPSSNTFTETVSGFLDEDKPPPSPTRTGPNTWDMDLHVIEDM